MSGPVSDLARSLIDCAPYFATGAEISEEPDSDGDISVDWMISRHRSLSVSVAADGRFAYAWLLDGKSGYGVVDFVPGRFPSVLADVLWSMRMT